jgi:LAGLIDADG DNA endonuclease family protein
MTILFKNIFLAIALPSLRISPRTYSLCSILVRAITLLYAAAFIWNVVYIQSIGSGTGGSSLLVLSSSGLVVSSKSKEECSINKNEPKLEVKPWRLTKLEQSQFVLSEDLKGILVGLLLGDLNVQKMTLNSNPILKFEQGLVHKDYLFHLYELFSSYCRSAPKITNRPPDKRTGNIYSRVTFNTY